MPKTQQDETYDSTLLVRSQNVEVIAWGMKRGYDSTGL
jgi:hypothetical protein